jgi:hypothetical protein
MWSDDISNEENKGRASWCFSGVPYHNVTAKTEKTAKDSQELDRSNQVPLTEETYVVKAYSQIL